MSFKFAAAVALCVIIASVEGRPAEQTYWKPLHSTPVARPNREDGQFNSQVACLIDADCTSAKKANDDNNLMAYLKAVEEWEIQNPTAAAEFKHYQSETTDQEAKDRMRLFNKAQSYLMIEERPPRPLPTVCLEGQACDKNGNDAEILIYLKNVDKWEDDWKLTAAEFAKENPQVIAADNADRERLSGGMGLSSSEEDASSQEY